MNDDELSLNIARLVVLTIVGATIWIGFALLCNLIITTL